MLVWRPLTLAEMMERWSRLLASMTPHTRMGVGRLWARKGGWGLLGMDRRSRLSWPVAVLGRGRCLAVLVERDWGKEATEGLKEESVGLCLLTRNPLKESLLSLFG